MREGYQICEYKEKGVFLFIEYKFDNNFYSRKKFQRINGSFFVLKNSIVNKKNDKLIKE